MKILFVDTYYPGYLKSMRTKNPRLKEKPYRTQLKYMLSQFFGTSDSYSFYLKNLGHDADDLIVNDEDLQMSWARENGLALRKPGILSKLQSLPYANRFIGRPSWIQRIALAQIKAYRPDVIYMQDLSILNPDTLKEIRNVSKLLVGQIASPLPPAKYLKCFDLIVTSFPHYVQPLRKMGINSEYFKIGFDPRILEKVSEQKKRYDVTFIGSFSPYHSEGTKILERIAERVPVNIWGQGIEYLLPNSPLRKNYHGEAWGLNMYRILAQSRVILNRHIGAADGYANNMRLYESTGMGAMLLTDKKKNLSNLFEVGKEVIDYSSAQDAVRKIRYYLTHEDEQKKISQAGQIRTLAEHTYRRRMGELTKILDKYLNGKS